MAVNFIFLSLTHGQFKNFQCIFNFQPFLVGDVKCFIPLLIKNDENFSEENMDAISVSNVYGNLNLVKHSINFSIKIFESIFYIMKDSTQHNGSFCVFPLIGIKKSANILKKNIF